MKPPSLRDIFWEHRGLLADKWEHYLPIYEAELRAFVEGGAPVTLLEIGVQNGGSLEIWRKLLPPRSRVIGLDIDERCRALALSEGIELHIGDATQQAFIDSALGDTGLDVVIDDGSHRAGDVIASFNILFERLKPGGLYIIEDLHCSYWPAYGGGFRAQGAPVEWAKDLIDALNADHFKDTADLSNEEFARLRAFNAQIARITFYDSMLVVQKFAAAKQRPFARLLTGATFPVVDPLQWIFGLPARQLGNMLVGPELARHVDEGLRKRLEEQSSALARQKEELERRAQELKRKDQALARREQEIESLRHSTSWKVTAPLRRAGQLLKAARRRLAGLVGRR